MVDITPLIPADRQILESYGDGGFRISGETHKGSLIVFPDRVLSWSVSLFDEIDAEALSPTWSSDPGLEILLLGCGAAMEMPSAALRQAVRQAGPVLEPMRHRRGLPHVQCPYGGRTLGGGSPDCRGLSRSLNAANSLSLNSSGKQKKRPLVGGPLCHWAVMPGLEWGSEQVLSRNHGEEHGDR